MKAVINTSVLVALGKLGYLRLIGKLFDKLIIAESVFEEIRDSEVFAQVGRLTGTGFADPHLNRSAHTCDVNYHFLVTEENVVLYEGNEKHLIKYYFPEEIKQCLQESSFQLIKLCPFLEPNGTPSKKTWNATAIARAA